MQNKLDPTMNANKFYLSLMLLTATFAVSNAQSIETPGNLGLVRGEYPRQKLANNIDNFNQKSLFENEVKQGTITLSGGQSFDHLIKLDLLTNTIKVNHNDVDPDENFTILPRDPDYIITINGKRFQYLDLHNIRRGFKGYFEIIKAFSPEKLLVKKYVKRIGNVSTNEYISGFRDGIIDEKEFYIINSNDITKISNHHALSLNALDKELRPELKRFLTSNEKITFDDDGNDLASLLTYYFQLNESL